VQVREPGSNAITGDTIHFKGLRQKGADDSDILIAREMLASGLGWGFDLEAGRKKRPAPHFDGPNIANLRRLTGRFAHMLSSGITYRQTRPSRLERGGGQILDKMMPIGDCNWASFVSMAQDETYLGISKALSAVFWGFRSDQSWTSHDSVGYVWAHHAPCCFVRYFSKICSSQEGYNEEKKAASMTFALELGSEFLSPSKAYGAASTVNADSSSVTPAHPSIVTDTACISHWGI
jgi:hypothetical protein